MLRSLVHLVQMLTLLAAAATVIALVVHDGPGDPPPGVTLGEHVYETTCVSCHGPSGEGRIGPAIAGVGAAPAGRRAMLDLVAGGGRRMPALSSTLTPGEIGAVVDHVRGGLPAGAAAGRAEHPRAEHRP